VVYRLQLYAFPVNR